MQKSPILLYLLRPSNVMPTAKMILQLMAPTFLEEGSTTYLKEKELYAFFVKYVKQVACGLRGPFILSSVLIFVIGGAGEPVPGFTPSFCYI